MQQVPATLCAKWNYMNIYTISMKHSFRNCLIMQSGKEIIIHDQQRPRGKIYRAGNKTY